MPAPDAPLYPLSPAAVPAGFTQPSGRYKWLVAAMLVSIVLFIGLYLALLAGAVGLVYLTLTLHFESYGLWSGLFHLGCILAALMLVVFLVKAVFKRSPSNGLAEHPRLTAEAHPALFDFVHRLCAEVGAAQPKYICVSSEVNAAVFYDSSLRSLFWPTRKNLLIGLGLVNGLNLSEFKAVLAHEFGHFAQRSMRLGSYVHTASRLLHDMVYERDKWDEMLLQWRALDIRLSAGAWLISGLVWVVRKLLELAYQGIHLVHASLSREMEFQADRVAVRLAGSRAMCDVLYQLEPVSNALASATQQLGLALEHGLATDDVFFHQSRYLQEQLALRPAPAPAAAGQPLRRFAPDELRVSAMYASHPADYLREEQAQRVFIDGPSDDRSPWLLFRQPEQLRKLVTRTLYPAFEPGTEPEVQPAAQVEEFLAAERAELEYAAHYAGTYDNRFVTLFNPLELQRLADEATLPPGTLAEARAALYGPELQTRTAAHSTRLADLQKLALFQQGLAKSPTFVVAGTSYPAKEAAAVAARLEQDCEGHSSWLAAFDQQVLAVHWRMLASQPERREDWLARFSFHYAIQRASRAVREARASAGQALQELEQRGDLTEKDVASYSSRFEQSRMALEHALLEAGPVPMLPLTHLSRFATLAEYARHDLTLPGPAQFNGDWINSFFAVLNTMEERLRRVYFKNLGVLLRLEEDLAAAHTVPVAAVSPALSAV
ncbi:hypothetical protein GCM10023185_08160 [Hymenobacter saemangeumensis]|uniref:Peptidase M48 domain-containing protein n=1 Tax=Hymenobacter saemangeumensis TaxID=1084522 RepID=A0ABP8I3P3_9BACT